MLRSKKFIVATAAALAMLPAGVGSAATHKTHANVDCTSGTYKDYAWASCIVYSGQVRVRADCKLAPDTYSPWVGKGDWFIYTGGCLFSVRRAIIETRY